MTPQELIFVKEYAKSGNATQSALKAGYSDASCRWYGYDLLQRADVQEAVQIEITHLNANVVIEPVQLLSGLREMAVTPANEFFAQKGEEIALKPLKDLPQTADRISVRRNRLGEQETTVKIADRLRAIELLGKQIGLFNQPQEVAIKLTNEELNGKLSRIDELRERLKTPEDYGDKGLADGKN
ncbi:MAG: terminase small subunit [Candidatus Methanomethylophilaceae archaeon]